MCNKRTAVLDETPIKGYKSVKAPDIMNTLKNLHLLQFIYKCLFFKIVKIARQFIWDPTDPLFFLFKK